MEVVRQVGSGLQALHDRDIVHRDVKPANVLFRSVNAQNGDTTLRAMLGDLGLGRALDMSSRLTMVAGTPAYVAPEQARARRPTPAPISTRWRRSPTSCSPVVRRTSTRPWPRPADPAPLAPVSTPERPFPAEVERVLGRGLAHDREDRYPNVTAFVTALEAALGSSLRGRPEVTEAWLPVDPDLTQPGPRPMSAPSGEPSALPSPRLPGRRGRAILVAAVVTVLGLGLGVPGGYVVQQSLAEPGRQTVVDDLGVLSVTVPPGWDSVAGDGWQPPNAESPARFAAVSVGEKSSWAQDEVAHGVFVALLPGDELPEQTPQHPECENDDGVVESSVDGRPSTTTYYSRCPGGVTVERVAQVADNRLLWVQVRSTDRATATDVLDSVVTRGL